MNIESLYYVLLVRDSIRDVVDAFPPAAEARAELDKPTQVGYEQENADRMYDEQH